MKKISLLVFALFFVSMAMASHLRCGYITAERRDCTSREVWITITVYTNTGSDVKFGEDGILNFGDATTMVVPRVENIPRPDLGPNIGMASYTVRHLYSTSDSYLISYVEPNRNGGILNMNDSFYTTFYTETRFSLATQEVCSVPVFVAPPVFSGFTNSQIAFSLGTASQEDIQITYEQVTPYRDRGLPVSGYIHPENMTLNSLTGLLTWNTELAEPGEYNFAVNAKLWGKWGEKLVVIGYTRIDFQVILQGNTPENFFMHDDQSLDEYSRILVPPGEQKEIKIFYEIDGSAEPSLEMFSALPPEVASFITYDSVSSATGNDIKVGLLKIIPREEDVRTNAYLITVRGKSFQASSDMNYLIYTDEFPPLPEPEIITATEDDVADVQVYPNPFIEQINVQVNRPGTSEVLLYNVQGQLIRRKTFESQTQLLMHEFPAGVYICDIRRNNISVRKIKLIKNLK